MRILITGAQGWLGRFTASALLERESVQVLGIGRSQASPGFSHELPGRGRASLPGEIRIPRLRYHYEQCDILDTARLQARVERFRPTHVVHLAGAVPGANDDALARNVDAGRALIETLGRAGFAGRVVFASTGAVYGEPVYLPQDEGHPINALTPYAKSKWRAEQAALEAGVAPDVEIVITRIFNLVGPGCPVSLLPGSLAFQLAASALGLQPSAVRMGPLTTVRDYVDVRDCAKALERIVIQARGDIRVINVASGTGTPVAEIWERLQAIAAASGTAKVSTETLPPAAANVSTQIGCSRRLTRLGYRPSVSLQQSLDDLYRWSLAALAAPVCEQATGNAASAERG